MQQMNQETKDSDMQIEEGVVECLLSRGMRNVRMRFKTVVTTTKIVVTGTPAYGRSWIWIPWNERPCVLTESNICGLSLLHTSGSNGVPLLCLFTRNTRCYQMTIC